MEVRKENYDRATIRRQEKRVSGTGKKGASRREERTDRNVVPSQLTSHLTSAWKVKISLEVYSKLYETNAGYLLSRIEKRKSEEALSLLNRLSAYPHIFPCLVPQHQIFSRLALLCRR